MINNDIVIVDLLGDKNPKIKQKLLFNKYTDKQFHLFDFLFSPSRGRTEITALIKKLMIIVESDFVFKREICRI